jgi:6,7-dimethyl-8-ribityllumazine synthase
MAANEQHYILPRASFDKPVKILIVVAPYYKDIADNLVAGAKAEIEAAGGSWDLIEVPGALEVTTHYDTVCNDSSRGITLLGLQGFCIGNGILTVENRAQAEVRADPAAQNKGGGAAAAALHLVALGRKWGAPREGVGFRPAFDEYQVAGASKDTIA